MSAIKNIFVGFLIAFIGSLPLGYLNVVGFEIYTKFGMNSLVLFLLGIISVEVFVIYFTLIFANKLVNNKKLMRFIDFFAVFFLLFLAYSFYTHSNQSSIDENSLDKYVMYSPFLLGIFLNCLNFLQIPFWTGWNLYLINATIIRIENNLKYYYIAGTLIGIFTGMLALIRTLDLILDNSTFLSAYVMPILIPLFFLILTVFQVVKVYRKYFRKENE